MTGGCRRGGLEMAIVIFCLGICLFGSVVDCEKVSKITKSFRMKSAPPHIHSKFAYVTWTKEQGYDIKA